MCGRQCDGYLPPWLRSLREYGWKHYLYHRPVSCLSNLCELLKFVRDRNFTHPRSFDLLAPSSYTVNNVNYDAFTKTFDVKIDRFLPFDSSTVLNISADLLDNPATPYLVPILFAPWSIMSVIFSTQSASTSCVLCALALRVEIALTLFSHLPLVGIHLQICFSTCLLPLGRKEAILRSKTFMRLRSRDHGVCPHDAADGFHGKCNQSELKAGEYTTASHG